MAVDWTEEEEQHARAFAREVVQRRMASPVLLFLEGMRPLNFISAQFLHFMAPVTGIFAPKWHLDRMGNFLEHRGAVGFVIDEIERLEAERLASRRQAKPEEDRLTDEPRG